MEEVLLETKHLQRSPKATPPVFIFGTYLGSLVLTNQRLLFLSSGGAGTQRALTKGLLGQLAPEVLLEVEVALSAPGSLAVPLASLRSASANRRWDFGRFLRVTYAGPGGAEAATSFIPAGPVIGSSWIDLWVEQLGPHLRA